MAELKTYDPEEPSRLGSHVVKGTPNTFTQQRTCGTAPGAGRRGREVARSLSNNPLHNIALTLQQTSDTNDYLSDLLNRDRASGGGGVVPMQVLDLRGTSLFAASQAWVVNWPTIENGSTVGEREWTLAAVATEIHVGGNQA